jgi:hypothetical protein
MLTLHMGKESNLGTIPHDIQNISNSKKKMKNFLDKSACKAPNFIETRARGGCC